VTTLSDDLRTLSREAFVYFYPLVTMDVTRLSFGSPNVFTHLREFPPADFRAVVRPNFDTLYSIAWLDLNAGPVILHIAGTDDRYFMLPMLDMWSDVFANPGKRTTGTAAAGFLVTGPGYLGEVPAGLEVIEAPTPHVWIIGRTQTDGPADYPAVHAVQDGYRIEIPGAATALVPESDQVASGEPLAIVNTMDVMDYFAYAAKLLAVNPPHPTDFSILARIARLGIIAGEAFDAHRFDDEERAQIEAGRTDALTAMGSALPTLGTSIHGWTVMTDTIGVYGNAYLKRAVVAMIGLGANPPEDAVYPLLTVDADGNPPSGDNDYLLHFEAGALPPVDAFWSVTMYDADGFPVTNDLNRFALGDRDPLHYNDDGSLDLFLQHASPGTERESNWLPAPLGPIGLTMRLYAPRDAVLSGAWQPPAVAVSLRVSGR
jgi:hypothetical protein